MFDEKFYLVVDGKITATFENDRNSTWVAASKAYAIESEKYAQKLDDPNFDVENHEVDLIRQSGPELNRSHLHCAHTTRLADTYSAWFDEFIAAYQP